MDDGETRLKNVSMRRNGELSEHKRLKREQQMRLKKGEAKRITECESEGGKEKI